MIESGESTHETGKHTKVEEEMEVEVTGKSLVNDKAEKPDTVAGKSSIQDKAEEPPKVADKSLDVFVGVSGGAAKNRTMIVERLETPKIFGTRIPMTFNLNNPILVPSPSAFP